MFSRTDRGVARDPSGEDVPARTYLPSAELEERDLAALCRARLPVHEQPDGIYCIPPRRFHAAPPASPAAALETRVPVARGGGCHTAVSPDNQRHKEEVEP
jgi:hypothetical protein